MTNLQVSAVPAFQDNYFWLIDDTKSAIIIDPGSAFEVEQILKQRSLKLSTILLTHHHADHIDGVKTLLNNHQALCLGPSETSTKVSLSECVSETSQIQISAPQLKLQVIAVPGHTLGHIAWFAAEQKWLFCGDTLFAAGCGRLFEGSAEQMFKSLQRLAQLPDDTQVFCAHEYTLNNLKFALTIEPDNALLQQRFSQEQNKRDQNLPTLPSSIGLEKQTNPFLRCSEKNIQESVHLKEYLPNQLSEDADERACQIFTALRLAKDNF